MAICLICFLTGRRRKRPAGAFSWRRRHDCLGPRPPSCTILKTAHDLDHVLDVRRRGETVADQLAPFLEIGGFTEILGVVLQRFPLHEEPIALRHFVRALQGHELAAFGTLEDRPGLFYAGFEFGFHSGFYVDLRDFEDHGCNLHWRDGHQAAALWSALDEVKSTGGRKSARL